MKYYRNTLLINRVSQESGFGTLGIIAVIGMLIAFGFSIQSRFSSTFEANKRVEQLMERKLIGTVLQDQISCKQTLGTGTCTAGSLVNIKNTRGEIIAGIGGNKILNVGPFTIRPECNSAGNGIILKGARLVNRKDISSNSQANFLPEFKHSNHRWTWDHRGVLLLPEGNSLCSSSKGNAIPGKVTVEAFCQNCSKSKRVSGYAFCAMSDTFLETNYDTDAWTCSVTRVNVEKGVWEITAKQYDRRDNRRIVCSMHCLK